MIISALISQCRQDYGDIPKSIQAQRNGDGSSTLFNVGHYPVIEGSYAHYVNNALQVETTNFTFDKDSGDLQFLIAPGSGLAVRSEFKYANYRDANWVLAINSAI